MGQMQEEGQCERRVTDQGDMCKICKVHLVNNNVQNMQGFYSNNKCKICKVSGLIVMCKICNISTLIICAK